MLIYTTGCALEVYLLNHFILPLGRIVTERHPADPEASRQTRVVTVKRTNGKQKYNNISLKLRIHRS